MLLERKEFVGDVVRYHGKARVCIVRVLGCIRLGDKLLIKGAKTNLKQEVTSMQTQHRKIREASSGSIISLRINARVRSGDKIYKLIGESKPTVIQHTPTTPTQVGDGSNTGLLIPVLE